MTRRDPSARHLHAAVSRRGAATMLLTVVVASCLVVFGALLQGARLRAAEADLLRALRGTTDAVLSRYCGILLQRYGILAFEADSEGEWSDRAMESYEASIPAAVRGVRPELRASETLADRSVLAASIRSFVLERLPALAAATALDRLAHVARTGAAVSFDPLFDAGGAVEDGSEDWGALLLQRMEKASDEAAGSGEPSPDWREASYDAADATRSLRECALDVGEWNRTAAGDPAVPSLPSPLDPEGMGGFLADAGERIPQGLAAWLDRGAVDLYAATMFRSRVTAVEIGGAPRRLLDLRGRALEDLATERSLELEGIVAGRPTDDANAQAVETRILAVRLALHLLAQALDEASREKALLLGETISAVLSAASSGALAIPGRFLAAALQAAWAYSDARSDVDALVAGKSVRILPDTLARELPEARDWEANYGDYLLLLLLAVPDDVELERIAERIEANIGLFGAGVRSSGATGPALAGFATAAEASAVFRGNRIAVQSAY